MGRTVSFLFILLFQIFSVVLVKSQNKPLLKCIVQLEHLRDIEYSCFHYYKDDIREEWDTALCFFDFSIEDTLIDCKYYIESKNYLNVYNGELEFDVNKEEERIRYRTKPNLYHVNNSRYFGLSYPQLRLLLRGYLEDDRILFSRLPDETVDDQGAYVYEILAKDHFINFDGLLIKSIDLDHRYKLYISSENFLPVQFEEHDYESEKMLKFRNLRFDSSRADSLWHYDRFSEAYQLLSDEDLSESIYSRAEGLIGFRAPDFELFDLEGKVYKLGDYRGKYLLIEFWFPFCKACIDAMPELEYYKEFYDDSILVILGIEFTGKDEEYLKRYIKKYDVHIPTVMKGKKVAHQYGVMAAPTFVLIDPEGIVLHAWAGYSEGEIGRQIEAFIPQDE